MKPRLTETSCSHPCSNDAEEDIVGTTYLFPSFFFYLFQSLLLLPSCHLSAPLYCYNDVSFFRADTSLSGFHCQSVLVQADMCRSRNAFIMYLNEHSISPNAITRVMCEKPNYVTMTRSMYSGTRERARASSSSYLLIIQYSSSRLPALVVAET